MQTATRERNSQPQRTRLENGVPTLNHHRGVLQTMEVLAEAGRPFGRNWAVFLGEEVTKVPRRLLPRFEELVQQRLRQSNQASSTRWDHSS